MKTTKWRDVIHQDNVQFYKPYKGVDYAQNYMILRWKNRNGKMCYGVVKDVGVEFVKYNMTNFNDSGWHEGVDPVSVARHSGWVWRTERAAFNNLRKIVEGN